MDATAEPPVLIISDAKKFEFFVRSCLANYSLHDTLVQFTENGIMVYAPPLYRALRTALFFDKKYFPFYKSMGVYFMNLTQRTMDWKKVIHQKKRERRDIHFTFDGQGMSYSVPDGEFGEFTHSSVGADERPTPNIFEMLDEKGIPKKVSTLYSVGAGEFKGLPKTNDIIIEVKGQSLKVSGVTRDNWIIGKELPSKAIKEGDVSVMVAGSIFKPLTSLTNIDMWNICLQKPPNEESPGLLVLNWNKEGCWGTYFLIGKEK